jgi:hypothetical protein
MSFLQQFERAEDILNFIEWVIVISYVNFSVCSLFQVHAVHFLAWFSSKEQTIVIGYFDIEFQYSPEMNRVDPDHLLGLVTEVIPDHSCLIFCPTKKNCENVALMLSKLIAKHRRYGQKTTLTRMIVPVVAGIQNYCTVGQFILVLIS